MKLGWSKIWISKFSRHFLNKKTALHIFSTGFSKSVVPFLMRLSEHVSRTGEKGNAYSVLVGKPEGKRPLRGSRLSGR